jgi:peptide deformylase
MIFAKRLEVCQLGDPVLRQIAAPVTNIRSAVIQNLINNLITTLKHQKGVGIAAPQVGQSLQLIIIASYPNDRYPDAPLMDPLPMINPQIIHQSPETIQGWEGCLSVPGIRGQVSRATTVTVSYLDRHGQPQQQEFSGFVARIIQHEYDHLIGKVFLDRVPSTNEMMTEAEYRKLTT